MTEFDPNRIHFMSGFVPAGHKVRAVCRCGTGTTPRANDELALKALLSEHGTTRPVCALCGHDYHGSSWMDLRDRDLQVFTDPATGNEFLACRGLPQSCRDGGAQQQVHLDRAAADELGVALPRPHLRVIPGGTP